MRGRYKPQIQCIGGIPAMAIERTLSIIKPDATERNLTGQIVARLEAAGLARDRAEAGVVEEEGRQESSTRCIRTSLSTRTSSCS